MAIHGRLKKMYRQEIILAKKRANEKFIFESHNKCKAAWKVINAETGRVPNKAKEKIPITADDFNSFFINVVNVLKNSCDILDVASSVDMLKSSGIKPPGLCSFKWTVVNSRDVYSSVYRLSNSRSEDVYGLSNFVLKEILDVIIYPLTQLINWVLTDGIYPQCLKITITVPLHKKGDKMNLNNYRPIALVPVISKLIETIVKNQLEYYFEYNNLISSSQYGFRKNLSTVKAVDNIVSYVLNNFENKEETAAVLLDLSKAFDVVPHDELIQKLKYYGLENNALSLIMSYLSNRLQLVKVGDQRSGLRRVASGVPQGSVLGPFLFTVFINDLPKFVPGKVVLYADDTTLLSSDRDSKLNDVIMGYMRERSYLWFSANKLTVNNNKTEEIVFSLRNAENKSVKLLGINLDSKLNWGIHTNHLCIRLARVIFLLKKLKLYTSLNLVISAYYAFFNVHLLYGVLLWGNSSGAKTVFKWQKKAIRCIVGISDNESCRPFFEELGILTLPCIYILHSLVFVKENLDSFNLRSFNHEYNTRIKNTIDVQYARLSKTQQNYAITGARLFNKLPLSARSISVGRFKNVVAEWLKRKTFYSVDEIFNDNFSDLQF
ncbi:hypothetical protein J6590_108258 [Homalodisca vitripennis]|nr:hypothetical protein J6590_108258 [Homalodisca vitripennis]